MIFSVSFIVSNRIRLSDPFLLTKDDQLKQEYRGQNREVPSLL